MGKHDFKPLIREKSEDGVVRVLRADVPDDDYYKAQIKTLQGKVEKLEEKLDMYEAWVNTLKLANEAKDERIENLEKALLRELVDRRL